MSVLKSKDHDRGGGSSLGIFAYRSQHQIENARLDSTLLNRKYYLIWQYVFKITKIIVNLGGFNFTAALKSLAQ